MNSDRAPAHPVISVLLPVYNAAPTLAAAVNSILRQDFQDFELLIVDDGSTDESRSIAHSLAHEDVRIKVLETSKGGLVKALNLGISVARGPYLARMDADDLSRSDRFRVQLDLMSRQENLAVVGSFMREIDELGSVTGRMSFPETPAAIRQHLRFAGNVLAHSSVMMRRHAVLRFGGYRNAFKHAEDYDLWLRIAECYDLCNIPEFLLDYRRGAQSVSASNVEQQCLSTIGARRASELRAQGKPDPSDGISVVRKRTLFDWGITEQSVNSSMQEWIDLTRSTAQRNGLPYDKTSLKLLERRYHVAGSYSRRAWSTARTSLRRWAAMHPRLSRAIHSFLSRHALIRSLHHSVSRLWRR